MVCKYFQGIREIDVVDSFGFKADLDSNKADLI